MNKSQAPRDAAIVQAYNENLKIADIAKRHNVSEQTVMTVVRNARASGAVTRSPRVRQASDIAPDRNQRISDMYNSGSTLNAIGEYFGLTRERVRQILERSGVDRRNMTEHTDAARERIMTAYGPMVDAAFEESRSINKVVEQFHDTIPARWIRTHLEGRRHETVWTNKTPRLWSNEQILALLRDASSGKGTLSISAYRQWRSANTVASRRPPSHTVIAWRFGSWRNAVTIAGLADKSSKRVYARRWERDDAMQAVALYVEGILATGQRATFAGYDLWSRERPEYPSGAYVRHLTGMSWSQVLRSILTRQAA